MRYQLIEIFTAEEARWQGEPLAHAVVELVQRMKIAARCLVFRGIAGSYENGDLASTRLEVLSYNFPLLIKIILPAGEAARVLAELEKMVTDGLVTVREIEVLSHRTSGRLLPRHLRVRDIMTASPQRVTLEAPLEEVARLLLSCHFTGLPVVDGHNRPVGVISQTDLIYKAGLPMRLGLLAQADPEKVNAVLASLGSRQAREVMTQPPVTIGPDAPVAEAVQLMLDKKVKRLPVVDDQGKLAGILSGADVFHAAGREAPDWQALQHHAITVTNLRLAADFMEPDGITAGPETPVEELIRTMAAHNLRRLCVVDAQGGLAGLISDRDLLAAFAHRHAGLWDYFAGLLPFARRGQGRSHPQPDLGDTTAREIMKTDLVTVLEDDTVDKAIRLMLEEGLKSLPVVNSQGKFQGLLSRESLWRGGFASAAGASSRPKERRVTF